MFFFHTNYLNMFNILYIILSILYFSSYFTQITNKPIILFDCKITISNYNQTYYNVDIKYDNCEYSNIHIINKNYSLFQLYDMHKNSICYKDIGLFGHLSESFYQCPHNYSNIEFNLILFTISYIIITLIFIICKKLIF